MGTYESNISKTPHSMMNPPELKIVPHQNRLWDNMVALILWYMIIQYNWSYVDGKLAILWLK